MAILKKNMWFIVLSVSAVLLALTVRSLRSRIVTILTEYLPLLEGFSSKPYWDVKRYSWGYGTAAPGPTGSITRAQGIADAISYAMSDMDDLLRRITRNLNANQWAAYLLFAYNLGIGNAYNLVAEINAGDDTVLEREWKRYVYSGGEIDQALVNRRMKEWELWNS